MLTTADRLSQVLPKVQRAKEHAAALKQEVLAFLSTTPYQVGWRHDPTSRKLIYFVSSVKQTPERLPLIVGDVIQNLMSALDHLAFQLVSKDTMENPPSPTQIYFPIADDLSAYDANKGRRLKGASPDTINSIDQIKPYRGGNDLLWSLYKLNNIEKHRLLLTVGSQAAGIHLGQLTASHVRNTFPAEAVALMESMNVFLNPSDQGFPLRPGFELYVGTVDEQPNPKQQFRFSVALTEAEANVVGKSLVEITDQLVNLVEGVVTSLAVKL